MANKATKEVNQEMTEASKSIWTAAVDSDYTPPTSSGSYTGPVFLDLKSEDSVELTFLDPVDVKPPTLTVFNIFNYFGNGEKYPTLVLDPASIGIDSPIAELAKEIEDEREKKSLTPYSVYCQTVVRNPISNGKGGTHPAHRMLRLVKATTWWKVEERIKQLSEVTKGPMADVNDLYGNTFIVSRSSDSKAARVGEITDYLETPDLSQLCENPVPFNKEELVSFFESDISDMEAFVERYRANQ